MEQELQLRANAENNNELLREAGVKRIHGGWYTVTYNGVSIDKSNITSAKRNKGGRIGR